MPGEPETTDAMQSLIAAVQSAGEGLPPVHLWNPEYCGEMDMVIRRDGTWWHEGRRITRDRLTRLFSTILRKDEDGRHYLVTPVEKVPVEVETAPFLAIRVDRIERERGPGLVFTTNMGDLVAAGPERPLWTAPDPQGEGRLPFVRVRGALDALITRPVFYELAEMSETRDGVVGVESEGAFFALGPAA
jgi:hypothetical protein